MVQNRISSISEKYSQAILDIAIEKDCVELFDEQLSAVCEIFALSDDLCVVMNNTAISQKTKNELLEAVFSEKINTELLNFLKILVNKNRFADLININNSYKDKIKRRNNQKDVEIVSSVEIDEQLKFEIVERLERKLNCKVLPKWLVNDTIIAGLVFKFDDFLIDTSVKSKLKDLSKNILR